MKTTLLYGTDGLTIEVPDHSVIVEPKQVDGLVRCQERFDVVITSNICASECSDGLPDHGNYAKILQMRKTHHEILEMINDHSFRMFDQWQVQKQAVIQAWADVYVYSSLPDEMLQKRCSNRRRTLSRPWRN